MRVLLDTGYDEEEHEALNYVIVSFPLDHGVVRNVKITYEGVFQEILDEEGDIIEDMGIGHDDMLFCE